MKINEHLQNNITTFWCAYVSDISGRQQWNPSIPIYIKNNKGFFHIANMEYVEGVWSRHKATNGVKAFCKDANVKPDGEVGEWFMIQGILGLKWLWLTTICDTKHLPWFCFVF